MGTFGKSQISGSVFAHWADTFSLAVTTVYPSTSRETTALSEWVEIWVNARRRRAQRSTAPTRVLVTVICHCFVKQGTERGRIYEITDAARETLQHQDVAVVDGSVSDAPVVGRLQFREADVRFFTRDDAEAGGHTMQHAVLVVDGVATAV